MGKWLVGLAILVTVGVLAPGCSSGGAGGGGGECGAYKMRLQQCGFTNAANAPMHCYAGAANVCVTNCLASAECVTLTAVFCGGGDAAFSECITTCLNEPFACGNGQTFTESDRCDGYIDCDNGADEQGCPTFQCGSGEAFPPFVQCNGHTECADGSDEVGCPAPGAFQAAVAEDCAAKGF